jgi:hypothetical protein
MSTLSKNLKNLLSEYIRTNLIHASNETMSGLSYLALGPKYALNAFQINGGDNIPQGDETRVPLQFIFESAYCRIFYTGSTLNDSAKF